MLDTINIGFSQFGKDCDVDFRVVDTDEDVFRTMAEDMIEAIQVSTEGGKKAIHVWPGGPSGQYPYLVDMINAQRIDLKNVIFLHMDEYINDDKTRIPLSHPISFGGQIDKMFFDRIDPELNVPDNQKIYLYPGAEKWIPDFIAENGGIYSFFGGFGINGHIALNEPPETDTELEEYLKLPIRIGKVAEASRTAEIMKSMGGVSEGVPHLCITLGMKEIMAAKILRMYAFRDWHRGVVRQALHGPISPNFPCSLIRLHSDARVVVSKLVTEKPIGEWSNYTA